MDPFRKDNLRCARYHSVSRATSTFLRGRCWLPSGQVLIKGSHRLLCLKANSETCFHVSQTGASFQGAVVSVEHKPLSCCSITHQTRTRKSSAGRSSTRMAIVHSWATAKPTAMLAKGVRHQCAYPTLDHHIYFLCVTRVGTVQVGIMAVLVFCEVL